MPDERLPEPVEAAAYYLIAEAITNVAKHANASHVAVSVRRDDAACWSRSPTTASAAPIRRGARGSTGSPTASRRSTGTCASTARPAAAPASRRAFRSARHDRRAHVGRRPRGARVRRGGGRGAARQRPPGREDGLGDLRAGGRMELHRRRALRLAPAAGEPHRRADGAARLRVVPLGAELRRLAARVLARVRARRPVGRRVPAADHELPVGPAGARARPRAGDRGLPDLHRGLDPGHVVRRSARARMRRLPDQRAADPPRPGSRARRDRLPGPALRRPVRHRARPPDAALAAHRSARAPPAHAGLRVRPAHLPARDGGHGGRGRRRGVGGVLRHRAAALRLSGRAAAQPRGAPGRRPARPGRRAARLARAARGGRRHRAPAPGAQSARRRAGTAGGRSPCCSATRAGASIRTPWRPRRCSTARWSS